MSGDTKGKTPRCRFELQCLDRTSQHPCCCVKHAFGENLMFVERRADHACRHHLAFGLRDICTCPTHYALHGRDKQDEAGTTGADRLEGQGQGAHDAKQAPLPQTVDEAVRILLEELPLNLKMSLANAGAEEIGDLTIGLGDYIRNAFGLAADNQALLASCTRFAGCEIVHPDDAAAAILARLVGELVCTHRLRQI